MKSLYYFNPITVVNSMPRKDVLAWSGIYDLIGRAVGMVDRSGTLAQPIRLKVYPGCSMPALAGTNKTYDDCVDQRVEELYALSESTGKPLGILWSGGIDSTMIMVGFLRNYTKAELEGRVKIITSVAGITENPRFYKHHILPNFPLIDGNNLGWYFDGSMILVTGELNDQLFGSDLIRSYLLKRGPVEINGAFNKDQISSYVESQITNKKTAGILVEAIAGSAARHGISLEKNTDFFWWYNFCFKWQTATFRIYALPMPDFKDTIDQHWHQTYLQHFYQSHDFQLWSMNHPEVRYVDDFRHYKRTAKDSICAFDGDEHYRINKIKRPSLQGFFQQRVLCEAITEDFELLEKFNPFGYYNPDNPFNA